MQVKNHIFLFPTNEYLCTGSNGGTNLGLHMHVQLTIEYILGRRECLRGQHVRRLYTMSKVETKIGKPEPIPLSTFNLLKAIHYQSH